ncbi:oligosaccharide flippase family protein, partial [Candidatus Parcubacteria bacterium]|nr:oligosaccharide flippase family protein [Candidatus Parcubacteria bacterium]
MVQKLRTSVLKLTASPLARGSFVVLVGATVSNFANYIFNLSMGRMLGPADYGTLAALAAVLSVVSVPSAALATTVVKFTTEFKGKKSWGKITTLLSSLSKVLVGLGVLVFLSFTLFQAPVAGFLRISPASLIVLLGAMFLINFPQTVNNGILQGLQKFKFLASNSILASAIKLGVGVGLVAKGYSVAGAMTAIFLSLMLPYWRTFFPLKFLKDKEHGEVNWVSMYRYAAPTFLTLLGMTLLISNDVVLVKKFFPAEEAGLYAALSLVGRVILYATSSVVGVMFTLVAERQAVNARYQHLLRLSLLLVGSFGSMATIFYFAFPNFVMRFFFGPKYLGSAQFLGFFAIFVTLYSLCNVLVNFFLSVRRTDVAWLTLLAAGAQLLLITLFHR